MALQFCRLHGQCRLEGILGLCKFWYLLAVQHGVRRVVLLVPVVNMASVAFMAFVGSEASIAFHPCNYNVLFEDLL